MRLHPVRLPVVNGTRKLTPGGSWVPGRISVIVATTRASAWHVGGVDERWARPVQDFPGSGIEPGLDREQFGLGPHRQVGALGKVLAGAARCFRWCRAATGWPVAKSTPAAKCGRSGRAEPFPSTGPRSRFRRSTAGILANASSRASRGLPQCGRPACSNTQYRVVRSTTVPIADRLPVPVISRVAPQNCPCGFHRKQLKQALVAA
jgi:hypothetical protein